MKFEEAIHFDQKAYVEKISKPSYSYYQLANNIYRKRRKLATIAPSALSTVATAVAAHHPATLLGLVLCFREEHIQEHKLILLELEWRRRGQPPLPHRPVQDTVIPVILTFATGALSYVINVDLTAPIHNFLENLHIPGFEKVFEGYSIGAAYTTITQEGLSSAVSGAINYAQNVAGQVNNIPNYNHPTAYNAHSQRGPGHYPSNVPNHPTHPPPPFYGQTPFHGYGPPPQIGAYAPGHVRSPSYGPYPNSAPPPPNGSGFHPYPYNQQPSYHR